MVFLQQGGNNEHAHICASLELFAASVMPAFKARHAEREARKNAGLAPCIERAAVTLVSAIIEATERSMPPAITTTVCAATAKA